LPSLRRALRKFGVFPLHVSQGFLFFTKEPGVFNLFTGRECSKRFESDVNTYLGRGFWQTFEFTLNRERDVPFAGGGTVESTRFENGQLSARTVPFSVSRRFLAADRAKDFSLVLHRRFCAFRADGYKANDTLQASR